MKLLIVTQKVDMDDDVLGFFHDWLQEFARQCESLVVICLYEGRHILPDNVRVLSLGKECGRSRSKYLFRFYHYIVRERNNYDAVFVHMNPLYVALGGIFWRVFAKKIGLWYMHKTVDAKLIIAEKITNYIFSADECSFRLPSSKLKLLGHGIDLSKYQALSRKLINQRSIKLISIGRLSPIKDYETIIKALFILSQKDGAPRFDLVLIGGVPDSRDDSYERSLKSLVDECVLTDRVSFMGPVPNYQIGGYLQEADIFINASQTGSLDKAIIEAMAAGLPVLTCNDAGVKILGDDASLLSFRSSDENDLSEKILKLSFLNESSLLPLTERMRSVAAGYDVRALVSKIVTFY